jgi:hypothetical protein
LVPVESLDVELGSNGAVLVRVHSRCGSRDKLPDAVFTFRVGDPQYDHWKRMLDERMTRRSGQTSEEAGVR